MSKAKWNKFTERIEEFRALRGIMGLLSWDQETYMPPSGITHRSQQTATLSALLHDKVVDPRWGDLLNELDTSVESPVQKSAVKKALRNHNRSACIPRSLVEEFSKVRSESQPLWSEAKQNNDISKFLPALENLVRLSREYAAHYKMGGHLYNALLDGFDQGMTVQKLDPMFTRLKAKLVPLVNTYKDRPQPPRITTTIPEDVLTKINHKVIHSLGFDLKAGRLDTSSHPFTSGQGPKDVRLTTSNRTEDILGTLTGTIHECGHGLYEQGLPLKWMNIGLCEDAGCGIHESQSRFYENIIGRSYPFFVWLSRTIAKDYPAINITPQQFYGAANRISPSLIRIYADETTYNLHIIIRYEIEKQLISGQMEAKDVPEAWAKAYQENLGVRPKTYAEGFLQDIHWSLGYFGYFPSYTIGNLFSASYKFAMQKDIPDMWEKVKEGEFETILKWLRKNIHDHGCVRSQDEIVQNAVGKRDHVEDLIAHFKQRQERLYS